MQGIREGMTLKRKRRSLRLISIICRYYCLRRPSSSSSSSSVSAAKDRAF